MYARVVKFESGDPDGMAQMIKDSDGPPEGVAATRIRMLTDRSSGVSYVVTYYDSDEDMRAADEVFNNMEPPPDANAGRRTSVDLCEVLLDLSRDEL